MLLFIKIPNTFIHLTYNLSFAVRFLHPPHDLQRIISKVIVHTSNLLISVYAYYQYHDEQIR